jgi:hypothetical protein
VQPAAIDHSAAAIIRLLGLAAGGGQQHLRHIYMANNCAVTSLS